LDTLEAYPDSYRDGRKKNVPSGKLADAIIKEFKSFEEFKKQFSEKAVKVAGSGWCWLIEQNGKLIITLPIKIIH
jgi:superoxide dismutase